jgi:hypothetical protein
MDRKANDWGWLPSQMPTVARLIREKRRELGEAHINMCWRRGVVEQQPGWFFAREGALAVGTPWDDDPEVANFAQLAVKLGKPVLVLRPVGVGNGA